MFGVDWDSEGRREDDLSEDFNGFLFARSIGDDEALTGGDLIGLGGGIDAGNEDEDELRGLPDLGNGSGKCSPCRVGGMVSCNELPALIFNGGNPRLCASLSPSESGDESPSSS
jgi:hypothetical protein